MEDKSGKTEVYNHKLKKKGFVKRVLAEYKYLIFIVLVLALFAVFYLPANNLELVKSTSQEQAVTSAVEVL